jgi:hypothetical protein
MKPNLQKWQSPESRGFQRFNTTLCFILLKPGTPPAIVHSVIQFTTRFRGPWYRQAGDSPLYIGLTPHWRRAQPVLGPLIQAGQGFLLYTGTCTQCASPCRFGNLGTGRPGIPSFIAPGDGSPAASGHRPGCRPSPPAAAALPAPSAITRHHSSVFAS